MDYGEGGILIYIVRTWNLDEVTCNKIKDISKHTPPQPLNPMASPKNNPPHLTRLYVLYITKKEGKIVGEEDGGCMRSSLLKFAVNDLELLENTGKIDRIWEHKLELTFLCSVGKKGKWGEV